MITIFTPTYNRAYILPQLYNSLIKQNNNNFEWIIVDDGSTDSTKEIVDKWIKEKKIVIRYFYQENQGKPIAHNCGVKNAKGELFVCVDSDDYLTENAVKTILDKWRKIKYSKDCTGIVGMRITENGMPVGTLIPKIQYSTLDDLYTKYKYKGDTILIFRTEIIKKYLFPKIEGEKFIPETYLYDKIDQEGKLATIQEGIYICKYLEDGYTANTINIIKNNPKGYALCAKQKIQVTQSYRNKFKFCAKYVLGNILANEKGYIHKSPEKILTILSIPFAYSIYYKKYYK